MRIKRGIYISVGRKVMITVAERKGGRVGNIYICIKENKERFLSTIKAIQRKKGHNKLKKS